MVFYFGNENNSNNANNNNTLYSCYFSSSKKSAVYKSLQDDKMCKTRTAGSMSGSGVSVIDAPLWISVMQTWPVNSPADTNVCRRVNDEFHGMLIIFFFVSIWHPLSQSVWLAQSLWTTSLVTWTPTMCKINLCSWHQNCF